MLAKIRGEESCSLTLNADSIQDRCKRQIKVANKSLTGATGGPNFHKRCGHISIVLILDPQELRAGTEFRKRRLEHGQTQTRSTISLTAFAGAVAAIEATIIVLMAAATKFAYIDAVLGSAQASAAYSGLGLVGAILAHFTIRQLGLYEPTKLLERSLPTGRLLLGLGLAFLLLLALLFILKTSDAYSRGWILLWFSASFVSLVATRAIVQVYVGVLVGEHRLNNRVAIYGARDLVCQVSEYLKDQVPYVEVVGVFNDDHRHVSTEISAMQSDLDALVKLGQRDLCDYIIVALPSSRRERIRDVVTELSVLPVAVSVCTELPDLPCQIHRLHCLGRLQLLEVQRPPLSESDGLVKSVIDSVLSAIALVLLAPLFLIIAICIKLDSPGPIFFVQRRNGYNQRIIGVIKFRTMMVLEDGDVVPQAKSGDKRVTRVGRFLRSTSLDELPQILNVLRGEMSLVGPRPHALAHNKEYQQIIAFYGNRHRVKPGITGLAQVNGCRGETPNPALMQRRVAYDLKYIENWSIALDVEILLRTILTVLRRDKAH